ncbi:MAG: hypothetical protein A2W17_09790 [Planctomycetes bacterium RBG_16_41_13]|nr:MAG: hypothetical protein A2W17_09790 [Planctomycetes bacterium RBG_16_41_13]
MSAPLKDLHKLIHSLSRKKLPAVTKYIHSYNEYDDYVPLRFRKSLLYDLLLARKKCPVKQTCYFVLMFDDGKVMFEEMCKILEDRIYDVLIEDISPEQLEKEAGQRLESVKKREQMQNEYYSNISPEERMWRSMFDL